VTSLPDWLVERAALDEVPPAMRYRIDRADASDLAARIAALRADDAAELSAHPPDPAVAQIDLRVAAESRRLSARRRARRLQWMGIVTGAAALVVLGFFFGRDRTVRDEERVVTDGSAVEPTERVKGPPRLFAFRQAGDNAEELPEDTLVREGDVIQLRYKAGDRTHGVIASIDGAGVVTLHFPASVDAPAEATALSTKPTALPNAYALDDAPRFERFFFITANRPIDVPSTLAGLRKLAHRDDSATGRAELTDDLDQLSLRLRKPDRRGQP
jgi:hypothetical protein